MKAAVFMESGKMEVHEVEKPIIQKPTDAILKIVRACVCWSDLWWYRGITNREKGSLVGHEAIAIVEEVGDNVKDIKPGDFVIAPFTHGCGHCVACLAGFDGNCVNQEAGSNGGYQGEYLRFTNANWALVKIPGHPSDYTDEQLNDLLTLADVMATGYHAAASAEAKEDDTVAVIGDGAVGLCGVIGAKLRGDDAVKKVLECVGAVSAIEQAGKLARPGAIVGRVGVPQTEPSSNTLFWKNIGLRGGIASVTTYDRAILLDAVLKGKIHPGKVFTKRFSLDKIQQAYEVMDKREAIKSLIIVSE